MSGPDEAPGAERWLRYAEEDLEAAHVLLQANSIAPRHACWLAQQAAEKALKAVLVFLNMEPPRTHNLDALRNRIPSGWETKRTHPDLVDLGGWAIEARYPDAWADATVGDARFAVAQANAVLASVRADLVQRGFIDSEQARRHSEN